jgi:hypothetical protein
VQSRRARYNSRNPEKGKITSDGIYFELRLALAMAAGGSAGVWTESEAVEDRAKRQGRNQEDCEMEVAQLGHGGRVAVRVGDKAQGDGADGNTHAHAELHHGAEEAIGAAHPAGRDLRVGQRSHAGELHGSEGPVEEEDGEDEDDWRGGAERRAKGHGGGRNDSVHDQNAAEAKAAKDLDDDYLHTQVSGEEREQVEARLKSIQAEGDLEHER